ncbi:SUMF1/EgtB/PvdO family nonheme iron enzyme [Bradyrhizobium sp. CB1650]|uniref:SUMF1/EgtB/PvdO family nonheme iron enzyme n=1 Tax=Bradyrhizobium sp. CB1650 TaxID=3039153 RepID=UPI0024349FB3|nr:SUMF1/EgtB/PvdO family nonheme iron enzyme [Bradyrhizobium sp. CB1650]WGD56339.1 SUMF1/EgtB/PvdO family nonheme iron enzyme [Bradyrhizobium sp. CB1650]
MKLSGIGRILVLCATVTATSFSQPFFLSAAQGQNVSAPDAGKRVALVVGNGSYPLSPVRTAVADAKAIAELLKAGGFDVIYAQDAGHADLDSAIKQFSQKLERGSTAVVYFAGHAIQYEDRNLLVPVDGAIASDADIRSNTVDVDLILDPLIVSRPRGSVVILDAARKNPWQQKTSVRTTGLASVGPIQGITQAYPASPGQVVEDQKGPVGLFAGEFAKAAKVPDRTLKEAFRQTRAAVAKETRNKQVPWETSLDTVDFVVMQRAEPTDMASRAVSRLGPSDAVEQGFWDTIKGGDSAADFQAYLDAYPNGPYASQARSHLQRLGALSSPAKPQTAPNTPPPTIRDCPQCPELVLIPSGSFNMGSTEVFPFEGPVHQVSIRKPFYMGRYEVTYEEWDACVMDRGCTYRPDDAGAGRGRRPVSDVDWNDAKTYVVWLSQKTGKMYRLPTESEWEYSARAATSSAYPWGRSVDKDRANCSGCTSEPRNNTVEVGSFKPNAFGLFDMAGNAAEWVEDCWNEGYRGAPTDGSASVKPGCRERVLRGGSFNNDPKYLRSAARFKYDFNVRYLANGFRVVREKDGD